MKPEALMQWLIGLVVVSIVLGAVFSYLWYWFLCWLIGTERKLPSWPKRPIKETGQLTGIVERVFFTVAIATNMSGVVIAMVGWITIKNSILWPKFSQQEPPQATVSFLSSIGSLLIAVLGGQICLGNLHF